MELCNNLPVDFYFMLPSCVPATDKETSGASLSVDDLLEFKEMPMVLGLAEMMNYPGVVSGSPEIISKIAAFSDRIKDGHAPLLSKRDLNAYVSCGLRSDHECSSTDEATEKARLGMHVMIREGTQAKNLQALIPLVSPATAMHYSLVTDDLHPHDLLHRGHLNYLIDEAIDKGLDPVSAIQLVTLSTARYFGISDSGAIAPGYRADIAVLSTLHPVTVETMIKAGEIVFQRGHLRIPAVTPVQAIPASMRVGTYDTGSFAITAAGQHIRVIGVIDGELLTSQESLQAPVRDGYLVSDPVRDLIKVAVIERHHGTGNIGLGMVRGFGLRKGALASSVSHDSHNIICVGCSDSDMFAAVRSIEKMGGGLVAVVDGRVLEKLPLPVAGLMSERPLNEVASQWERVRLAAEELGCTLNEPFMSLSFLALPVIPELKITDRGLFDVLLFEHVPLFY